MSRRRFLTLPIAAGAAGVMGAGGATGLGACARAPGGRVSGPEKVTLGDIVEEDNPHVTAERFFARRFEELSGNRFTVAVRPRGELGDHNKINDLVRTGKLAMGKTFIANLAMFDRRIECLSLPWTFTCTADLLKALDGRAGASIKARLERAGILLLGFFAAGPRNLYNALRPVRTPEDLRGMRIRVPQDVVSLEVFNACGAEAIPLAFNDINSALRNHFVDGAENSIVFYATSHQDLLAKFWSWTRHQMGVDALIASNEWFAALEKRDQNALMGAAAETIPFERQLWRKKTEDYIETVKAHGVQMNDDVDVASFKATLAPVVEKYRGSCGDLAGMLPIA